MKKFRKGLATLLCISMAGSMFPVPVSAERTVSAPDIAVESAGQQNAGTEEKTEGELALYGAQTDVEYLEYDKDSKKMVSRTCDSATELTSENTSWGKANQVTWFVARGDITMEKRVAAYGEVHLILADDCNLKIEPVDENNKYVGGIGISQQTYHLYIHAQSEGDKQGTLVCRYTSSSYAALGDKGSITIDGGNITCEGNDGAGIGGSSNVTKGTIGTVTINGGTINATSIGFGAAIGSGSASASDGTVVINGGTINAESRSGAGIGGGSNNAGIVTINGGDITAKGGGFGAGIGGGQSKTGTVTINGGKITAANTCQSDLYDGGAAGIGGGTYKNGIVTINGGEINAASIYGAGIGGGYGKNGFGNDITITDGLVKAVSQKGSGIGPGYYSGTADVAEEKLTIENSPFIFASGGSGGMEKGIYKQDDSENWSNIISIDGSDGKVYGNSVTTAMDVEIAEDQTLVVPEGTTLAVGEGTNITNNGTIKVAGTMASTEADKVTVNKPKYKLITKENPSGIYEDGTTAAGKIYYSTYGEKVTVSEDSNYDAGKDLIGWTVDGANVPAQRTSPLVFAMPANEVTVTAEYGDKGPAPDLDGKVKVSADTIEISGVEGTETYGDLEFLFVDKIIARGWEKTGKFTELTPDTEYTIHVRYTGKGDYATSQAKIVTVKTKKWADEVEKVTDLTATYGQTLNDVDLPDGWAWKDSSVKLNSVGAKEYEARFTPSDTADVDYSKVTGYVLENGKVYLDISLEVTVTQAKPVIQWAQKSAAYTYTGFSVTAGDLPGLSVTLQNHESYSGTFIYSYREKKDSGEAGTFISGLPTEPGVYEVKAAVSASVNYMAAESDIMTLTIQYLEGAPDAVTTDKKGSEYTKWCPAEFYIKAPTGYTISDKADGTYSDSFTYRAVSQEEQQEITYYLKNTDGQIAKKTLTAKIDRTAPDWNGDNLGINIKSRWWNSLLEEYIPKLYKADSLDVNVKANDSQSGVTAYYYYVQPSVYLTWTREDLDILYGMNRFDKVSATGNGEVEKLTELVAEAKDEGKLVYVCAVDAVGNRSDYICSNGIVFDNTAPTLNVEFQGGDIIWDTSVTCWLHCTEVGDYYYICKKAGEPAPSSINDFAKQISDVSKDENAEVDTWEAKDGVVTGKILSEGYSKSLKRYSQQLSITGLTSNTKYVLYMVATDEAGNASDVASLQFTTLKTVPYIEKAPKLVGEYGQSLSEMQVDDTDAKVVDRKGSETTVSGTWSVKEEQKAILPEVETTETFTLVFTPTGEKADRYETTSCEVTPEVAKKAVTVVIADKERPYEQNNPEFTWDFAEGSGLVAGDSNADLGITLDSIAEAASPGGKYAITGSCNSKKYDVNFTGNSADGKSGVLTITQAENKFTSVLVCRGYTYEKNKKPEPTISAKYGTVKYRYASFGADGFPADEAYTDAIPVNAGAYAIKAYVEATASYTALESTPVMFKIAKADAPVITGEEQSYIYAAGSEGKTVSVEIAEKLPADKGDVVYSCDTADAEGILSEAEVDESGKLTFRVNAVDASKIGKTATIKVKAVMQNYEDAEYALTVQMTDKKSVELQNGSSVAVEGNNTLTYGQKLSSLNLKKAVFVEAGTNTVVEGTLVWSEPEKVPAVGTTQADWVFRPVQDSIYKEMTGTTAITVVKAPNVPTSTPSSTPTSTPSSTPAGTPTIAPSSTPAGTPSSTPSSTPAGTPTIAPSSTPAGTPSSTPVGTPTIAPSSTPVSTPSSSPVSTPSSTPVSTPSSTPASAPSSTPDSTPAGTPSSTPGNTSGSTSGSTPGNTIGDAPSDTSENTSGSLPENTSDILKKGMKFTGADGAVYKILCVKKKNSTVMYYAAKKKAKGKVSVPATVKYKGVTFKVVSIRAKAFANRKKLQKVIIGKNVASIGKKAFYNCKKLKKVTIKTTKKIKKKVGKAAFKKTAKKIVFKLPAKKYKTYKKVLKKKGVSRKAIYKKYKKQKKQKQKK